MQPIDTPTMTELALRDPRAPFMRRLYAGTFDVLFSALAILTMNRFIPEAVHSEKPYLAVAITGAVGFAYYWVPEALWGLTVGKWIMRVRVVDLLGRPPGFGKALIRTLLRFVEVNPFLFGAIPAALVAFRSKTGQRLGDMLAKTYVLRTSDLSKRHGTS